MKKLLVALVLAVSLAFVPIAMPVTCVTDPEGFIKTEYQKQLNDPTIRKGWVDGIREHFKAELTGITVTVKIKDVVPLQPPYVGILAELFITADALDCDKLSIQIGMTKIVGVVVDAKTCRIVDAQILDGTPPILLKQSI
jgi:hypothetical protein